MIEPLARFGGCSVIAAILLLSSGPAVAGSAPHVPASPVAVFGHHIKSGRSPTVGAQGRPITAGRSLATASAFEVEKTIVLFNQSVIAGNFVSAPIQDPLPVAVDTEDGALWVAADPRGGLGESVNTSVGRVNASTGQVELTNDSGNFIGFSLLMYDSKSNLIFVGGGGLGVQEWNASTGTYVRTTPLIGPTAIALDPDTNQVYAVTASEVQILDVPTNKIVANVSVGNNPYELGFDPLNHSMAATNEGPSGFTGTSYVSFINDTNYTWFDTNIPNIGNGYHADPGNIAFNPINGTLLSPTSYGENLAIFNARNGSLVQLFNVAPAATSPYTVTYDPATEGYWVALNNGTFKLLNRNFSVTGYDYDPSVEGEVAYDHTTTSMLVPEINSWDGGGVFNFNATTGGLTTIWNLSGPAPTGTAFGGPNDTLFVDGYGQRGIWTLNSSTGLPGPILSSAFTGGPWRSVVADGSLFTTETNNGSVERWNGSAPFGFLGAARTDPAYSGAPYPEGIAFDAARDRLLVADNGSSRLTVIDPLNLTNQSTVGVGAGPSGVVNVPTLGDYFVIDNGGDEVSVVNASSLSVLNNISLSQLPEEGTYDPAAGAVLVTEYGGDRVAEISTTTLTVHLIAAGAAPIGIAYDPVDDAVVIANSGSANLTILNGTTLAHVTNLAVGLDPETVSVDSSTGAIAVANYQSDSVSLVNGCLRASCIDVERFSATPSILSVGGSTNLSVQVTGAVGNVSYDYSSLPPGCTSYDSPMLYCAPAQPGAFTVVVQATDATGTSAESNLSLTVRPSPTPLVQSFLIEPSPAIVGSLVTFNFSVSGGVLPYSFAYSGLPAGCPTIDSTVWSCRPANAGNFTIEGTVRDANGSSASAVALLNTTFGPAPAIVNLIATPESAVVNQSDLLSLNVTGGWAWINTSWPALPPGCDSANTTRLTCVPSSAGTFPVIANVTDGTGRSTEATIALVVLPVAPLVTALTVSPTPAYVDENLTVRFGLTGGELPDSVTLTGLPPGCPTSTTSPILCVPSLAGTFNVTVTVTDAVNRTSYRSTSVVVRPAVSVPAVSGFDAIPNPVGFGNATMLSVTTSGGVPPLTFAYGGLPAGCTSRNASSLLCTPAESGAFNVSVTVKDSLNRSTTATTILTVVGNASSGSHSTSPPASNSVAPPWWLLGAGLVAIAVAVATLVYLRRRRAQSPDPTPAGEETALDERQ